MQDLRPEVDDVEGEGEGGEEDEEGGAFVFVHLSIIFIGRFSLLSIKEEEVYHLFWNGNISTQNASISISNWSTPS